MAVLLPTGNYTVRVKGTAEDAQGRDVPGAITGQVTVPGRVRTNAQGADITLDPAAWPLAEAPRDGITVEVSGPDPGGTPRIWVLRHAELRKGATSQLDKLSHVTAYGELRDTYQQSANPPGGL